MSTGALLELRHPRGVQQGLSAILRRDAARHSTLPSFWPNTRAGDCRAQITATFRTIVQIATYAFCFWMELRIGTAHAMQKLIGLLVAVTTIAACVSSAFAQTRYTQDQIDPSKKNPFRIRDIANRPCVTVKGTIDQDKVNTAIVKHYLRAANSCPKVIKIKACYTQSTRCVEFTLRSLEHKEILLGTTNASMPNLNFDFTEKEVM
jgi:hypothetical protein